MEYTLTTARLGLRNWRSADLEPLLALNQDPEVMAFFPNRPNLEETKQYLQRMQVLFEEKGYCYFAVDRLDRQEFIGFIGLCDQHYEAFFTPCVDIGWRLRRTAWGQGFATEGAIACLNFGFKTIGLKEIFAVAPVVNRPSVGVMKKIGMEQVTTFDHPKLLDYDSLRRCVLYRSHRR